MTARSSASQRRFVLGRHGDLTAYATDHPYVAQVVDAAGRPVGVNDGHAHVFRLLKFGWEQIEPPGWRGRARRDPSGRRDRPG